MVKKLKKVNNRETETQVVKAERKHVNERHQNGLYSDAELTEKDKQSELYKEYINIKNIPYCKQFLHKKKDLPQWGEVELKKLTEITQEYERRKRNNHELALREYHRDYYVTHQQAMHIHHKDYYNAHKQKIKEKGKEYYKAHTQERKDYGKDYRNANKEKIKEFRNAHKEYYQQHRRKNYKRAIESIRKIRNGKIDELSDKQLQSVQSLMRQIHKHTTAKRIHGLRLGDKNNDDVYAQNTLQEFKDFLKSQVGLETVSQIDFNELNNMPFDFNVLGDEEKFDNSYFNNDSIPNENYQQDNNDQPTNTQKEQTIDKYGFVTYGHKPNITNDEELFALNHAHDFNEQSV